MKEIISYDKFSNESVRDLMKPKSELEIDSGIIKYFGKAYEEEYVDIDTGLFLNDLEDIMDKYKIFDNYYAYKGKIYFLYASTSEYEPDYKLTHIYENIENFKKKLEKGIEKINSMIQNEK